MSTINKLKQFLKRIKFLKGILPEINFSITIKEELQTLFEFEEIKFSTNENNEKTIEYYKVFSLSPNVTVKGTNYADIFIPFVEQIIKVEESLSCQA